MENPKGQDLQLKFQDLTLIFTRFQLQMSQYGYESAEIIQHLSEYLQTVDLSNVNSLFQAISSLLPEN